MPRQMYGLGSLVKSVKKAASGVVKGVKDIAKSDVGKLALTAASLYYAPKLFGGVPGFGKGSTYRQFLGGLSPFAIPGTGSSMATGTKAFGIGQSIGNFFKSPAGIMTAITVPSVLAAAGVEEEQIPGLQQNKPELIAALRRGYKNLNPGVADEEVEEFVRPYSAEGGRIGYAMGSPEDNAIQASGIMGLPLNENPAGITELDLRETGGFIPPVGVKEKADDIPAMLSNNEFVFTADAVRGMGGGDVDKGAERMYAMMKTLENGGRV